MIPARMQHSEGLLREGPYIPPKAAQVRFTETTSAGLREHGLNANCVLPTILDTPENRIAMPGTDPERRTRWPLWLRSSSSWRLRGSRHPQGSIAHDWIELKRGRVIAAPAHGHR